MTQKKILVLGFYNKSNLGDELFKEVFKYLLPNVELIFTSELSVNILENIETVIIGGGSLLGEPLSASLEAKQLLLNKQIMYIGVGPETNFHDSHIPYLKKAVLIAPRNSINIDKLQLLNKNICPINDLVYALPTPTHERNDKKSILVVPNILVVPKWNDPHWKHAAWQSFKVEFAQFLDEYIANGYVIDFFPMSSNQYEDDSRAATEIINSMNHKKSKILNPSLVFADVVRIFSQYNLIFSQRFHGSILAHIAQSPYITIHHHDKLKHAGVSNVSYYGIYKHLLQQTVKNTNNNQLLPIDRDIFNELKKIINTIV